VEEVERGAGVVLVAEEALVGEDRALLGRALLRQAPWSDLPLLILISHREERNPWLVLQGMEGAGHVVFLERPLRTATLLSAVQAALEARQRQYQVRDELARRKEVEEVLRASEQRVRSDLAVLETVYRYAPVGLCVLDGDLRYVRVNDRLAKINGVPVSEHLGKTIFEVVPDIAEDLAPLAEEIFKRGRAVLGREVQGMTAAQPSRPRTWIEHWVPLAGPDGGVTGISVVVHEITERKELEEKLHRVNQELGQLNQELEDRVRERTQELAEAESKYRGLVENTGDVPFNLDSRGRLQYVGPQVERYGFSRRELEGLHLLQVVAPEDRREMDAAFRRMMDTGRSELVEFRIRSREGEEVWLEERGQVIRSPQGGTAGLTGVLRDVTGRKAVERIKTRREEQLRALAGRLASAQDEEQRRIGQGLHDDVAQLLSACGMKLALSEKVRDPDRIREVHQEVESLLTEATEKVRTLSFELYSATLNRLGLGAAIQELCETMARRYDIHVEVEGVGECEGLDDGTSTILFKAVRELLFNVVKHAQVDHATVRVERDGNTLRITVEDGGVGFPPSPDGARIDMGRGLGLFAIRERLEELGGGISIESEPGVLTRVTVWVPLSGRRP
jgi:PAS domain S-box-containing protein